MSSVKNRKNLNIHVSPEEYLHLRGIANDRRMSLTAVVRELVQWDIRRQARRAAEATKIRAWMHPGEKPA